MTVKCCECGVRVAEKCPECGALANRQTLHGPFACFSPCCKGQIFVEGQGGVSHGYCELCYTRMMDGLRKKYGDPVGNSGAVIYGDYSDISERKKAT